MFAVDGVRLPDVPIPSNLLKQRLYPIISFKVGSLTWAGFRFL